MIGLSLQHDSRVRSSTARFLALFLSFSVLIHGLYYPQEWLFFGLSISAYVMLSQVIRSFNLEKETGYPLGLTDSMFLGMVVFSLLGLVHPVKGAAGLLEALRWGIFWIVYRLGMRIAWDETAQKTLLKHIEWLAIAVALIAWLPWVDKVAGRLSSVFGYPNTLAAFLGAVLLLNPRSRLVQILLLTTLLATGSRAGVGLFVIVLVGQQLMLSRQSVPIRKMTLGSGLYLNALWLILLGTLGVVFIMFTNPVAWENLTTWRVSSSSWQERLVYIKDGIRLAWDARGLPQAGGWLGFPTVQHIPYWTTDPHSSFIHILLNQGIFGVAMVGIWGSFRLAQASKTGVKRATKAQVQVGATLLFLALHSLMDADFSFGSLGILFWLLLGSIQKEEIVPGSFYGKRVMMLTMSNKVMIVISGSLFLACGSILLNPAIIEKERTWNALAVKWSEENSEKSIVLWHKSLNWDQTQSTTRQRQAEYLLRRGNIEPGLEAVEDVLKWQSYNIEAYEWAQSVVWDAAEMQRGTDPEMAFRLYSWIERVPMRMEEIVDRLTRTERLLWQGHRDFLPSPHIMLLAEHARQRQLT